MPEEQDTLEVSYNPDDYNIKLYENLWVCNNCNTKAETLKLEKPKGIIRLCWRCGSIMRKASNEVAREYFKKKQENEANIKFKCKK